MADHTPYEQLHDLVSDLIESGTLTREKIPAHYDALIELLSGPCQAKPKTRAIVVMSGGVCSDVLGVDAYAVWDWDDVKDDPESAPDLTGFEGLVPPESDIAAHIAKHRWGWPNLNPTPPKEI